MIINLLKLLNEETLDYEFRLFQDDLVGYEDEYLGKPDEAGVLVKGSIKKLKQNEFLIRFTLNGVIVYPCARCLDPTPVDSIFDFEDVIETDVGTETINLVPYASECLFINEPFKVLCDEECKGLCPSCGANLNHEECSCEGPSDIDPRMEALKKLL
ncbi:MAG: DUF177 domain-containing protein [Eubacterium sp.]